MKDKENQFEEIAKSCKNCVCNVVCDKKLDLKYFFDNHDCEHYQPKLPKDSVVLSREELEEKYEPSETFMAVTRELEELKESLADKVVLSRDDYGAMEIKIEQLTKYAENERQLREYYCNEARKEMIEKIYRKGKELDKYFGKTELGEYLMANYISRNNLVLK